MAIRDLDRRLRLLDANDTPITDSLNNNDQFNYAHLVKFEKPTNPRRAFAFVPTAYHHPSTNVAKASERRPPCYTMPQASEDLV